MRQVPFYKTEPTSRELASVFAALDTGIWSSGCHVERLESLMYSATGRSTCAVSSGTAAMHVYLLARRNGYSKYRLDGEKVAFPAITFSSIPMACHLAGMHVVFFDVTDRCELDLVAVKERVCHVGDIDTVVPTHMTGKIMLLQDVGVAHVVEDCCHLYPGYKHDDYVAGACTHSEAALFSFYPTKCVATMEGGAIVSRLHGTDKIQAVRSHGLTKRSHYPVYDIDCPGINARMSNPAAALAMEQFKTVEHRLTQRRALVRCYREEIGAKNLPVAVLNADMPVSAQTCHLFVIQVNDSDLGVYRDRVCRQLHERGVQTSMHFPPLHQTAFWRSRIELGEASTEGSLGRAEEYGRRAISLPLYPSMSIEDVRYVVDQLCSVL